MEMLIENETFKELRDGSIIKVNTVSWKKRSCQINLIFFNIISGVLPFYKEKITFHPPTLP